MSSDQPLVDAKYLLEKFPGKGGWTYAAIPEIPQNKHTPFGWVRVRGRIDDYELKRYKLQPMGNGQLFLPVKAAIRKAIGKTAGDHVHIILFLDELPSGVPEEILDCFANEPKELYDSFNSLSNFEKKAHLDWIYDAKTEDGKAQRIVEMMAKLEEKSASSD